ncbi:MAG: pantetheine-phosphate adenylyltransferase [Eubacteriales bacterium]|nr:pantetheine-phosphate adenylyltransferase [Eubacteriales bacterium]
MQNAVYPGSFDPVTLGHMDIIERAASMVDHLTVCILDNPRKKTKFTLAQRLIMLQKACAHLQNVKIASDEGLLVNFAMQNQCTVIVRGLRTAMDFEYELQMAQINKKLSPQIETIFLASNAKHSFISSSMVRELAYFKADLTDYVPHSIVSDIIEAYKGE